MPSLTFEHLHRRPEHVPTIARWWFDEWGHEAPGLTAEANEARVRENLGALLPVTIVALRDGRPVGVAALKAHELFDVLPERTPWLGGVYVVPEARGEGLAARLVGEIEAIAARAGFRRLWLDTEVPDGGLYARLGWRIDRHLEHAGLKLTVMDRLLEARDPSRT